MLAAGSMAWGAAGVTLVNAVEGAGFSAGHAGAACGRVGRSAGVAVTNRLGAGSPVLGAVVLATGAAAGGVTPGGTAEGNAEVVAKSESCRTFSVTSEIEPPEAAASGVCELPSPAALENPAAQRSATVSVDSPSLRRAGFDVPDTAAPATLCAARAAAATNSAGTSGHSNMERGTSVSSTTQADGTWDTLSRLVTPGAASTST